MLHPLWLHLDATSARLRRVPRLSVACDFDGTLTDIVPHPDLAILSPRTRHAIEAVAQLPGAEVAIFSGRMLDDLRVRVPVTGLFLSGIAGLETLDRSGKRSLHVRDDELIPASMRETMRGWCERFEGAWVEDKGPAFALHYRGVPERFQPAFCSGVRRRFAGMQDKIRLLHGKKVFDVLPAVNRDKASALWDWIDDYGQTTLFYFGDDANDEPVYQPVREKGGITVAVGRWSSHAEYGLVAPGHVTWFLEWLAREWREVGGTEIGRAEDARVEAMSNDGDTAQPEPERVPEPSRSSEG